MDVYVKIMETIAKHTQLLHERPAYVALNSRHYEILCTQLSQLSDTCGLDVLVDKLFGLPLVITSVDKPIAIYKASFEFCYNH